MVELFLKDKPIGNIKGILFDKDGTLSNSEDHLLVLAKSRIKEASHLLKERHASSFKIQKFQLLLKEAYGVSDKGINPSGVIAIASRTDNLISTATVLCLIGETWPKAIEIAQQVFEKVDEKDKAFNQSIKRPLIPGVLKVLKDLSQAKIRCGLISNDTSSGIDDFLETNDLKTFFRAFWSADNYPPKPNPEAVKGLCKDLELKPSECALIGDADSDLKMAKQAGIALTLGFTAGWSQSTQLKEHEFLINSWDEIKIKSKPALHSIVF